MGARRRRGWGFLIGISINPLKKCTMRWMEMDGNGWSIPEMLDVLVFV